MRRVLWISLLFVGWFASPAAGQVLEEHGTEATLSLSHEQVDKVGSFSNIDASALFILAKGYLEIGPLFTYTRVSLENQPTFTGAGFGPRLEANLLPSHSATPFVTGSLLYFTEELKELFKREQSVGIGFKIFVGDSAAFRITVNQVKHFGERSLGGQKSTLLTGGLSLFFGGH
jgi:hypothetical protein